MLPSGSLALLLLLALVPGWVFLRLRQRHSAQPQMAGLAQLLEVLAVGLATTGTAVVALVIAPHRWLPFFADVDKWAQQGGDYASTQPRNVMTSVVAVLVLACVLAALADQVFRRQRSELYLGPGVWVYALRERPPGTLPYLAIALQDGSLVEGLMHSCSLEASEVRDVALGAPIRITPSASLSPSPVEVERVVIPEREIRHITVQHVPEAGKKGVTR
jgi:uncharacterized membrane protein YidH (DUF202 family)